MSLSIQTVYTGLVYLPPGNLMERVFTMQLIQRGSCVDQTAISSLQNGHLSLRTAAADIACKGFWLALLLTQDVELAESAVAHAIESLPPEQLTRSAVLRQVAAASWVSSLRVNLSPRQTHRASALLPFEMQGIFQLPYHLRYCFCLRILVGIPAADCCKVMSLLPEEVERFFEQSICSLSESGHLTETVPALLAC